MKLTYDEISPITRNKCVLTEKWNDEVIKMCDESGYTTVSGWVSGSDVYNLIGFKDNYELRYGEDVMDILQRKPSAWLKKVVVDGEGHFWLPSIQRVGSQALYPSLQEDSEAWEIGPVVQLRELEGPIYQQFDVMNVMSGNAYDNPTYILIDLFVEQNQDEEKKVVYEFIDTSAGQTYNTYQEAFKSFQQKNMTNEQ